LNNQLTHFTSEPDRFGRAFFMAAAIEIIAIAALAFAPRTPPTVPPSTLKLQIVAVAPAPVAKPTPPKPVPTPPQPPQPVAPPQPLPPPPKVNHPQARPHPRPVVHTPPPEPTPPLPAPPAPETAAPPPSPQAEETLMSHYIGEVRALVLENLVVPQQLIDAGLEGDCVLQFTLAPDGKLLSVSLDTPSGLKSVNEAAMDALRATHLPAFLPGMPGGPHSFTLPVHVSGDQS
jgi:protein TonB